MNTEIEKKWFVYIGDHHEGPFRVDEIQEKKKSGLISDESYVWCDGMPDWVMLSKISELKSFAQVGVNPKENAGSPKTKTKKTLTKKSTQKKAFIVLSSVVGVLCLLIFGLAGVSQFASDDLHTKLRPLLTQVSDSFPFLSGFFKMVPNLSDVKAEDQKDLEQARTGSPENGVKIALALSQNDFNRPFFYVSTNLPDRTKFDLYLIGNSETLLNRLQYSGEASVMAIKGFGKSEVFLLDGGQLIPKGEYQVFLVESSDQEEAVRNALGPLPENHEKIKLPAGVPANTRFLTTKTYFIGGDRDETYLTRLKSFHEKIKQNSDRESLELKQYADTLSLQFKTMTTEFSKIYTLKKASPALFAAWKKDADLWQQINSQLDQTIQTWSKETLQNEFFYGKVYEQVKSAYETLKALFTLENNFVTQPIERSAFDIQHGKALSEAAEAVSLLQTKIDFISKAPKSPSGLPTREGL